MLFSAGEWSSTNLATQSFPPNRDLLTVPEPVSFRHGIRTHQTSSPVLPSASHFAYACSGYLKTRRHPQNRKYTRPSTVVRMTNQWPQATCTQILSKFEHVVFEICERTQTNRHIGLQTRQRSNYLLTTTTIVNLCY